MTSTLLYSLGVAGGIIIGVLLVAWFVSALVVGTFRIFTGEPGDDEPCCHGRR